MAGSGVLTGRYLADYRLGRLLGQDGFGQIYEALHTDLRRDLALRVLSERFTFAAGFEERFAHLGRVLAVLEHPNLLTLDDYGQDGPYAYVVTPLVKGGSLEEWLGKHPQEPVRPAQVLRIIGQLTSVLDYLHQHGVTHLGITPGRVLLEPNGHLLLADVGLPYLAEELWRGWNERQAVGNPIFLAPEQLSGSAPSSAACDIYAVGVLLYRLLSGKLPVDPASPAILEAKFQPPPSLRGQKQAPPPALEAITLRALHPVPEQRWPSISAFAEAFYTVMEAAGFHRAAGAAPGSAYGARSPEPSPTPERDESRGPGTPPPWSIAEPPVAPAFAARAVAPARPKRGFLTRLKFVVFTTLKILMLPLIVAVLGFAILVGYARWQQIQSAPPATPAPTVTPTVTPRPKHGSVPQHEAGQFVVLGLPTQKSSSSS